MSKEETYQHRFNKQLAKERDAFERDPIAQAQAELDFHIGREAAERAYQRRLERELDPFDWGHWGPFD